MVTWPELCVRASNGWSRAPPRALAMARRNVTPTRHSPPSSRIGAVDPAVQFRVPPAGPHFQQLPLQTYAGQIRSDRCVRLAAQLGQHLRPCGESEQNFSIAAEPSLHWFQAPQGQRVRCHASARVSTKSSDFFRSASRHRRQAVVVSGLRNGIQPSWASAALAVNSWRSCCTSGS